MHESKDWNEQGQTPRKWKHCTGYNSGRKTLDEINNFQYIDSNWTKELQQMEFKKRLAIAIE